LQQAQAIQVLLVQELTASEYQALKRVDVFQGS